MASLIFWENFRAVTPCFSWVAVACKFVQNTIFASFESIDWDSTFVSRVWLSGLNGFLKDADSKAWERLLNEVVANYLSFSEDLDPAAILALAAKSLPQSSTKSIAGVKPAEIFSGISLTIKWDRLRISTTFTLKKVFEISSLFYCATLSTCAISCMLLTGWQIYPLTVIRGSPQLLSRPWSSLKYGPFFRRSPFRFAVGIVTRSVSSSW